MTEAMQYVFKRRPELARIYEEYGAYSVLEYGRTVYSHRRETHPAVREAILAVAREVFDEEVVRSVSNDLLRTAYVSTTDHHGPLCHPSFFQSNLLRTFLDAEAGLRTTISLSCASVSFGNHSFPRGLSYSTRDGTRERIPFFSARERRACVFGAPAVDRERSQGAIARTSLEQNLKEELSSFFDDSLFEFLSYRAQVSLLNFRLVRHLGYDGAHFVSLPIEDVVRELIVRNSCSRDILARILFDHSTREAFLVETEGIETSHDTQRSDTTVLFWGIEDGKRIPLRICNGVLSSSDGHFTVCLTQESIIEALQCERIIPNLALCLIALSAYGLDCGGGYLQVDYLPRLIRGAVRALEKCNHESISWGCGNYMGGDFLFLPPRGEHNRGVLDMLCEPISYADIEHSFSSCTLADAIRSIIPDVHHILMVRK